MPASIDNALTTLNRLKTFLDISGNSKNGVLTAIILGASQFTEAYCRRKFKRQAYSNELINGHDGARKLYVKNSPIISGQTITLQRLVDVNDGDDWGTLDVDSYQVDYDRGYFYLRLGEFHDGLKNYRASYTAGFYLPSATQFQDGTDDDQDLPYDLEMAVQQLCSTVFSRRKSAGRSSEKVFQISITYAQALREDPIIAETLNRYKKMSYA